MLEPDDDPVINVQAAARFTGVAVASLAKMRCVGGSPAFIKAGRKILYRQSDLTKWLDARRVRSTSEAALAVPRRLTDPLPSSSEPNNHGPIERQRTSTAIGGRR